MTTRLKGRPLRMAVRTYCEVMTSAIEARVMRV